MRPRERRDSGQNDLFKARLDQIVDTDHALAKLGRAIDWRFLEKRFGAVYSDKTGHPPLPTRLMAGLSILKHMHDLSDEDLCARWVENPYYQLFCGEEVFQHKLTFDRSSLTRWRQRMGEERLVALIQESLAVATRTGAARPADFSKVIVDTTVQPKAVAFPTDAKLMHRARERLARLARKAPLACWHCPFLREVAQDEVEQFDSSLVGWEVASSSNGAPQFGVQGFDGVRGVDQQPHSDGKSEERDHIVPDAPPG